MIAAPRILRQDFQTCATIRWQYVHIMLTGLAPRNAFALKAIFG